MTCVIAYKDKDRVYIGADSLSSSLQTMEKHSRKDNKVFRLKDRDDILIGFCGSYRMGQLLQSTRGLLQYQEESEEPYEDGKTTLVVKEVEDLDYDAMIEVFVPNVIALFKEGDFAVQSEAGLYGGNFIVATKDRFYYVMGDFSVADLTDEYLAIGCGGAYAKGALDILSKSKKDTKTKILEALRVSEKNALAIEKPYVILNTFDDSVEVYDK